MRTLQSPEKMRSPNGKFIVVIGKGILLNKISPLGVDFEVCNFVDLFYAPKSTLEKVKKHNRSHLKLIYFGIFLVKSDWLPIALT